MIPLSAVVTTYNNAATLGRCLESLGFAAEIVLLDSGSTDATLVIARDAGARIEHQPFAGYGAQKAAAVDLARHDWILLLDADEWLPAASIAALERHLDRAPSVAGFRLPRIERVFWRYHHPGVRLNTHLRLFDRRAGFRMSDSVIHAAPEVEGPVATLRDVPFVHEGERDVASKVERINRYSTGLAVEKAARRWLWPRLLLYPPWFFLRNYLGKRWFLDGSAGFINAVIAAFYVFLKYAKAYELRRSGDDHAP